jgi:WD40 repeat protein
MAEVMTVPSLSNAAEQARTARYWAFISYSQRDLKWGQWLIHALETYRIPKQLVGKETTDGVVPKRLAPVFRDRDELSGAADLGEKIREAVEQSRTLIVICSPNSAHSEWVNKEVIAFKSNGRGSRVLTLIVDGEPNAADAKRECFPPAVRYQVDESGVVTEEAAEPLAADARDEGDGKSNALLKLIAGILDVDYDALRRRDHERRIRRLWIGGGIVALFAATFLGIAIYANQQRNHANDEARAARAALSAQTATQSRISLTEFPQRSLLLAVEALNITAEKLEPPVTSAEEALRESLASVGGIGLGAGKKPVESLALSPDGRWLVTVGDADTTAKLWYLTAKSGAPDPIELPGAAGPAAISPSNRWLAAAGANREPARLWDLAAPSPGAASHVLQSAKGPFVFSSDNRWLVTGGDDKSVRVWGLGAAGPATPPITLTPQINPVTVVSISPDSRWLVTSSWNPDPQAVETDSCRLWDLKSQQLEASGRQLGGITKSVSNVVFTPDGHWLATSSAEQFMHSGGHDEIVRLWDLTKNDPSTDPIELKGHKGPVTAMTSSIDSRWLVTGGEDKTARLWDLKSADPTLNAREFPDHEARVVGVVVSPDNGWLATIEAENGWNDVRPFTPTARLWKLDGGTQDTKPIVFQMDGRPVPVSGFVASPGDRRLVIRSGSVAYVLDLAEREPDKSPRMLRGHEAAVTAAAFSLDNSTLVTGSADGSARWWPLTESQVTADPVILHAEKDEFFEVSSDGHLLVTVGIDARAPSNEVAVLWNLNAPNIAAGPVFLRGHKGSIFAAAFSHDGHWLATGSSDQTARLWDLTARDPAGVAIELKGHEGTVSSVAFSRDGDLLITGSFDNTIRLWDLHAGNQWSASRILRTEDSVYQVAITTDSRWLLASGQSASGRLWDLNNIDSSQTPRILENSDESVVISADNHWLVTAGNKEKQDLQPKIREIDNALRSGKGEPNERLGLRSEQQALEQKWAQMVPITTLLDLTAKDPSGTARVLNNGGKPMAFSGDSHWLLSAGTDGVPRLWALTGQEVGAKPIELHGHTKAVETAAFSRDKRWLATGSYDDTVRLWKLSAEDISASSKVLEHYKPGFSTVAFANDWLLTANSSDTAHLWKLSEDGSPTQPILLPVDGNHVWGAAFTDDGRWLITRSHDTSTVSTWALKPDLLIELACRAAGRNFTQDEWQGFFAGQPYPKACPGLDARGQAGVSN